jgi:hypothetical protein
MNSINYKWLPEYVFSERYDKISFIWFDSFSNKIKEFMEHYFSLLLENDDNEFSIYEITDNNDLFLLGEYDTKLNSTDNIIDQIEKINRYGIDFYMSVAIVRYVFISKKNKVCIYGERDLEAVVIGYTTNHELLEHNSDIFMGLGNYTNGLQHFFQHKKELITNITDQLIKNYSSCFK